jgi:hypothetical protein
MGCQKLTYYENTNPLKVVYRNLSFEQNIAQRFLSVDPLTKEYAYLTPYQFASNMPIVAVDVDGLEADIKFEYAQSNSFIGGDGMDKDDKAAYQKSFDDIVTPMATSFLVGPILNEVFKGATALYRFYKTEKAVVKLTKAERLLENVKKGAEFEKKVVKEAAKTQTDVVEQITVKTKSGTKTKLDAVGTDKTTGNIKLTEAKSSSTAPLTKNQKSAFPELEQSGGTVVGEGKAPFTGGTVIPPTKVDIVRPQ